MDLIVDAHLDMAYNALTWKRDYHRSAYWTRQSEVDSPARKHNGLCSVGLPELTRGRVGVVFGTLFCQPSTHRMSPHEITYSSPSEAHAQGMAQLDFYRRWADADPEHIRLIGTRADLDAVVTQWTGDDGRPTAAPAPGAAGHPRRDPGPRQIGIVPLMEGADPILEPKELERWVERGLRIVGPAWDTTRYAGGTWAGGGLSALGRELLDMMAEFKVILDVSHLSQQALMESLDAFRGDHVIATHSNPRRFIQTDRHLPDEAIERIAERKGVIGVVQFNKFLKKDWSGKKQDVGLDDVVRMIDYICQLTGSADHVGIGTDADGGFGSEAMPRELDTVRDLHRIGDELLQRGYSPQHVAQIMNGNWLRVLRAALPA